MKMNFDKEKVGKAVKTTGKIIGYGVAALLSYTSTKDVIEVVRYSGNVDYGDVVGCILNSNMYSSDKTKMVAMVPKDRDSDFYKAIIQTVNASMYSSDKLKIISNMCSEE